MRLLLVLLLFVVTGCGSPDTVDIKKVTASPKMYVGSETCKSCHLEHHDSWQMTLHSKMLQNVKLNQDVIIPELDETKIRADLATIPNLKVPADQIYIPKKEEILYTIGSQWKQRYIIERDGVLVIAPVQYNTDTDRWVNYEELDWQKRSWILKCGGCHATGVDLEKNLFEPAVGCEACHGPGSWHVGLPRTAVVEKRGTIVNPAKLTPELATQICGSCHNRGKSTKHEKASWAVGYQPGKGLEQYFTSTSFAKGDAKHVYGNEFSKAHHQQFIDWKQSLHFKEGVGCLSCHYVHEMGVGATRLQTKGAGSKTCLNCHTVMNSNKAHAIHSFANCIGCHMPRIVKSAESGDLHSHVFKALLPIETIKDPSIPNSCQTCHQHKDQNLKELQARYDLLSALPKPQGKVIEPVTAGAK